MRGWFRKEERNEEGGRRGGSKLSLGKMEESRRGERTFKETGRRELWKEGRKMRRRIEGRR